MKILTLDADDIASACPMKGCIEEISKSFALQAKGKIQSPMRTRLAARGGDVLVMPSLVERGRAEGSVKVVSIFPENRGKTPVVTATVLLVDGESGVAKAVLEGTELTAIRTGAVSGLSCRFLARKDSKTLGVIGAGVQAFQQIAGVLCELPSIELVKIFSLDTAKSKALANECGRKFKVKANVEDAASKCVRGSDVVVTATTSKIPVFDGHEVKDGTHVIAMGAYRPKTRESTLLVGRRASIFVDSKEAALEEAGDLLIPIGEGVFSRDSIMAELSELVTAGRRRRAVGSSRLRSSRAWGWRSRTTRQDGSPIAAR